MTLGLRPAVTAESRERQVTVRGEKACGAMLMTCGQQD